jgi:hypothetical protein
MTETPKSAPRLLTEAADIARFRAADGWPAELSPQQLAALMAGGWKESHKREYRVWGRMIADAIETWNLTPRRQPHPPVKIVRDASDLSEHDQFRKALRQSLDGFCGVRLVYTEKREQPDTLHIGRNQCAAWLRAIGESPSEYVLAWLGAALNERAEKVDAGDTASDWKATARAIGEEWMLTQEKKTGKRPTIKEIAAYVADELSERDVRGPRGKYLDTETIKREALTGITGRKKGDNLRR